MVVIIVLPWFTVVVYQQYEAILVLLVLFFQILGLVINHKIMNIVIALTTRVKRNQYYKLIYDVRHFLCTVLVAYCLTMVRIFRQGYFLWNGVFNFTPNPLSLAGL